MRLADEFEARPTLAREEIFSGRVWDVVAEDVDLGHACHHVRRLAVELAVMRDEYDPPALPEHFAGEFHLHRIEFEHGAIPVDGARPDDGKVELEGLPARPGQRQDGGVLVPHIAAIDIDRRLGVKRAAVHHFEVG